MLKAVHGCKLLAAGAALAIIGAMAAPVSAGEIIIINRGGSHRGYHRGYHQPKVSNFIYGSPISTPIPVNPRTGLIPRRSINYSYPYSYRQRRRKLRNSTIVNPVLVNPRIRKSRVISPRIIRNSRHRRPWRNNTRIIIYPGYRN
ncbi:MAG: hypothetical protein QNJ47_27950 [Nostocaceae cyanobacterium]|nr:hypothetical protein [Nostocaceae cyanobacterium]